MPAVTDREVLVDTPVDGVTVLRLHRPEQCNAVGWAMWEQLGDAIVSAGGDVKSSPRRGTGVGAGAARLTVGQRVLAELLRLPKPTVAAVEGPAVGVGWSLALACDLIVAAEDTSFSAPFVQRGLVPDGGAAWFLVPALGRPWAAELLLLGDRLTARSAAGPGLVNRLTPAGAAITEAIELAGGLARGAPDALVLTKTLLRAAMDSTFERYLETEWLSAALDLHGPDAAEGRAAFVEKRPPDFRRGHL